MRILYDIRSLQDKERTGVGTFAYESARALLARGTHDYSFFANATTPFSSPFPHTTVTRYPNRLLNASFKLFGAPKIESLSGPADLLYLPNANFIATNRPFVTTIHDLSFEHFPEFFTAKQRAWHAAVNPIALARRAAAVVTVSKNTARDLADFAHIDPAKIIVAHPGIDASYKPQPEEAIATIRTKYSLPKKFFLSLGAIEPRKNVPGIIRAFDLADTDADLVIAGGKAWGWKDATKAAANAKKKDRIRFLGYVPHADKPALYAAAHAFVYPSFYEGFGLPPLEAMACGTPVVASLVSSLGEVIDDAGLLVNPDSARSIADAMELAANDETIRTTLRTRGMTRASRYTWEACAEQIEQAFEKAKRS